MSGILELLHSFIEQKPGLDPRDYGDFRSYRREQRQVTNDLHDARELLRIFHLYPSAIEYLTDDLVHSSGRLTLEYPNNVPTLEYCVGQYWPTEYRKAVARVCASALFKYFRDNGCKSREEVIKAFKRATSSRRILEYVK